MSERFDIAVVGAGPGGLAAAVTAADLGLSVVLIDQNRHGGGQIGRPDRGTAPALVRPWLRRLRTSHVRLQLGTTVWNADRGGRLETTSGSLAVGSIVLATGARERFLPFPGWTLPGVFGAGGLQALVHDGLPVRNRRIVVGGSGPLLLQVADTLRHHGARVLRVAEQTSWSRLFRFGVRLGPTRWRQALSLATPILRASTWPRAARGNDRVEAVEVEGPYGRRTLECDHLAVGFGLVPNLELAHVLGCAVEDGRVVVDDEQRTSTADVLAVGELTGVQGSAAATAEGICAGAAVAGRRPPARTLRIREREVRFGRHLSEAFALRPEVLDLASPETTVCRCEEVTRGRLADYDDWTAAKLATRCGMGRCQGRVCGPAAEALFGWRFGSIRPPLSPLPITTLLEPPDTEATPP